MPTYTVVINVNVPGLGNRNVTQAGVVAADVTTAITQATASVIVEVLSVTRTAP